MPNADILQHSVVHAEPLAYCAHPHAVVLEDGAWVMVFNRAPRRACILHPPQEPLFANYVTRSDDEGRSWSPPTPVPDYSWTGTECAGLTALGGSSVMLNQWRFHWYPAPVVEAGLVGATTMGPRDVLRSVVESQEIGDWFSSEDSAERLFPWYRGNGEMWVRVSHDGGRTFRQAHPVAFQPYMGAYGMRGGQILPDGSIFLALSDAPRNHVTFGIKSTDGGASWSAPFVVAEEQGLDFEEPGGIVTDEGRVILFLRELTTRSLYRVVSDDSGATWSAPEALGVPEYPANPFRLADGRVAVIVGRRVPPYGIRLYVSGDDGMTFDWDDPVVVRDLPNMDLGYPTACVRRDGEVVAIYYARTDDVTAIHQTVLKIG